VLPAEELIRPGWQRKAALEAAMRKLDPMDTCRPMQARPPSGPSDEQFAMHDRELDVIALNTWERDDHEETFLGFQNVDGRLPSCRLAGILAVQPVGSRQQRQHFRPYAFRIWTSHDSPPVV
jgi:hypothetical protein